MQHVEPGPATPTVALVKEAILDTRELVQTEIALAKTELRQELAQAKAAAFAVGFAAAAALIGLAVLVVGVSLAIDRGPLPALLFGAGFLVVAAIAFVLGYSRAPKRPLPRTLSRVQTDVRMLKGVWAGDAKERMA
jgi:uncharacterized membrane protein YqjE